jgi:large subunit ribosomal protein L9
MELILCEDVPELGKIGQVVKVSQGYARNYLLPHKKALVATPHNIIRLEKERKANEAKAANALSEAQKLAEKLSEVSITIKKEVGEEEQLYGSVTTSEILKELEKEGIKIDKKSLQMGEAIKKLGVYNIDARLHSEVKATLKVWVVKE